MATNTQCRDWKIPWTQEPGRLHSQRVSNRHNLVSSVHTPQAAEQQNEERAKYTFFP